MIGVTMGTPGVFTSGWKEKMGENADPADFFTSDDPDYYVGKASDGEVQLVTDLNDPLGNLDAVAGKEGSIFVAGWAYDPNDKSEKVDICVYIGGEAGSTEAGDPVIIKADTFRNDVDTEYNCGDHHGFRQPEHGHKRNG